MRFFLRNYLTLDCNGPSRDTMVDLNKCETMWDKKSSRKFVIATRDKNGKPTSVEEKTWEDKLGCPKKGTKPTATKQMKLRTCFVDNGHSARIINIDEFEPQKPPATQATQTEAPSATQATKPATQEAEESQGFQASFFLAMAFVIIMRL